MYFAATARETFRGDCHRSMPYSHVRTRRHRTRRPLLRTTVLAPVLLAALSACAPHEEEPRKTPSLPAQPSTPIATPTTFDVMANLPTEAKEHTAAGAAAFAKYFFHAVSMVHETPSPGELSKLCTPEALFCQKHEQYTTWLRDNGFHASSQLLALEEVFIDEEDLLPGGLARAFVLLKYFPTNAVDDEGKPAKNRKAWSTPAEFPADLELRWQDSGWKVDLVARFIEDQDLR